MNIGDGSGAGEDHCELVGGSEANALDAGNYVSSPSVNGTYNVYIHSPADFLSFLIKMFVVQYISIIYICIALSLKLTY